MKKLYRWLLAAMLVLTLSGAFATTQAKAETVKSSTKKIMKSIQNCDQRQLNKYLTNNKTVELLKNSWRISTLQSPAQTFGPNTLNLVKSLNKKMKYKIKKVKQTGNKAVVTIQVTMVNTDSFLLNRTKLIEKVEPDYSMAAALTGMSNAELKAEIQKTGFDIKREQALQLIWILMKGELRDDSVITTNEGQTISYLQFQYLFAKALQKVDELYKSGSQYINYGSKVKKTLQLTLTKKGNKWKIDRFGYNGNGKLRYLLGADLNRTVTTDPYTGAYTIEKWTEVPGLKVLN